jgi:hypothetical protein
MPKIKAILIDPFACTVEHVEVNKHDSRSYYAHLSHETMPVYTFAIAYAGVLKGRDAIFVDDDGLMKEPQRFFQIATAHQPFAGKGLIIGADHNGDAADAETSLNMVRMSVIFGEVLHQTDGRAGLYATRMPWRPTDES